MKAKRFSQKRLYLTILFTLFISAVFLFFTIKNVKFDAVLPHLKKTNCLWYLAGFFMQFMNVVFLGWRSKILFSPLRNIALFKQVRSNLIAIIGNMLLPYHSGDLMRSYFLSKYIEKPFTMCLSVISIEKLYDFFISVMFLFLALSWAFLPSHYLNIHIIILILIYVVFLLLLVVLVANPRLFFRFVKLMTAPLPERVGKFVLEKSKHVIAAIRIVASKRILFSVLLLSFFRWGVVVGIMYCWMAAFHLHSIWYAPIVVVLFLSFSMMIPAGPGYVGTYDYFAKAALVLLGVNSTLAATFALVTHFMAMVPFLIVGLPFVLNDIVKKRWMSS